MKRPLTNTYTLDAGASRAQVLWVPQYQNLTIASGVTIAPAPWDGTTGGILAVLVAGQTTINGTVTADGRGFRGSRVSGMPASGESEIGPAVQFVAANGGGGLGANTEPNYGYSGGGGAYATAGGQGIGGGPSPPYARFAGGAPYGGEPRDPVLRLGRRPGIE